MSDEELKSVILNIAPSCILEEGGEWINVLVEPADWKTFSRHLRNTAGLDFDYLFCLTCVDWKTHFNMVYHFTSTIHRHHLVVKCKLDRVNPVTETVCDIWRTAELLEREVYDLFGVQFLHHPDLRRLLLTDDWIGYPLRKDYEDPVNMIRL